MKIYTRKGDKGQTGLANGKRVSKADPRIEILGAIDELNSAIGVVIAEVQSCSLKLKVKLINIQNDLLSIGSVLANTKVSSHKLAVSGLEKRVKEFEALIDEMTVRLPPLKNFILPGGGMAGANLHLARAVCRRVERRIVELNHKSEAVLVYFNRLSDLLFTMARFVNFKENKKEQIWTKTKI